MSEPTPPRVPFAWLLRWLPKRKRTWFLLVGSFMLLLVGVTVPWIRYGVWGVCTGEPFFAGWPASRYRDKMCEDHGWRERFFIEEWWEKAREWLNLKEEKAEEESAFKPLKKGGLAAASVLIELLGEIDHREVRAVALDRLTELAEEARKAGRVPETLARGAPAALRLYRKPGDIEEALTSARFLALIDAPDIRNIFAADLAGKDDLRRFMGACGLLLLTNSPPEAFDAVVDVMQRPGSRLHEHALRTLRQAHSALPPPQRQELSLAADELRSWNAGWLALVADWPPGRQKATIETLGGFSAEFAPVVGDDADLRLALDPAADARLRFAAWTMTLDPNGEEGWAGYAMVRDVLWADLKSPFAAVRAAAATAIQRFEPCSKADFVFPALLGDADPRIRRQALLGLLRNRWPVPVPVEAVRKIAESDERAFNRDLAKNLLSLLTEADMKSAPARQDLTSADITRRAFGYWVAEQMGPRAAPLLPEICAWLERAETPYILKLGRSLRSLLMEQSPNVGAMLAESYHQKRINAATLANLLERLPDPMTLARTYRTATDAQLRDLAVEALLAARAPDSDWLNELIEKADADTQRRAALQLLLGHLNKPDETAVFERLKRHPNPEVRNLADVQPLQEMRRAWKAFEAAAPGQVVALGERVQEATRAYARWIDQTKVRRRP